MGKKMMAATASLLDEVHSNKVLDLRAELERELGIKGAEISPLPHFSYQCSRDFDLDLLQEVVGEIAAKARPLRIRTAGLAVFTGPAPVVYIPVVRSPELTRLQLALWSAGALATDEPIEDYHPARWIPHITIAQGDVTQDNVGQVVAQLSSDDLDWDLEVDNLSIVRGRGNSPQELLARFELGGSARNF